MHQSFTQTARSNRKLSTPAKVEIEQAAEAVASSGVAVGEHHVVAEQVGVHRPPRQVQCVGQPRPPRAAGKASSDFDQAALRRRSGTASITGTVSTHHVQSAQVGLVQREIGDPPGACAPAWRRAAGSGRCRAPAGCCLRRRSTTAAGLPLQRVQDLARSRRRVGRAPECRHVLPGAASAAGRRAVAGPTGARTASARSGRCVVSAK